MGIKIEFNPDLALRNIIEFEKGEREIEECIPKNLKIGEIYPFLKKGQRNYHISDVERFPVPLLETKGNEELSRPIAAVRIIEATHFLKKEKVWTKGRYKVIEIFDITDPKIHFESYTRVK